MCNGENKVYPPLCVFRLISNPTSRTTYQNNNGLTSQLPVDTQNLDFSPSDNQHQPITEPWYHTIVFYPYTSVSVKQPIANSTTGY